MALQTEEPLNIQTAPTRSADEVSIIDDITILRDRFDSPTAKAVELQQRAINIAVAAFGPIDSKVIDRKLMFALTLRKHGMHQAAATQLIDVVVSSQRADLDSNAGPSSSTLQAKHALRDSFAQHPGMIEEIACRTMMERAGLRGPGSTELPNLSAVMAELHAIAGNYTRAMKFAEDVYADATRTFGRESYESITAAGRLVLIAHESERYSLVNELVRSLDVLENSAIAIHSTMGTWERERLMAILTA